MSFLFLNINAGSALWHQWHEFIAVQGSVMFYIIKSDIFDFFVSRDQNKTLFYYLLTINLYAFF